MTPGAHVFSAEFAAEGPRKARCRGCAGTLTLYTDDAAVGAARHRHPARVLLPDGRRHLRRPRQRLAGDARLRGAVPVHRRDDRQGRRRRVRRAATRPRGRRAHLVRARLTASGTGCVQWSQPGSNRRPPACKAGALPAELWPREAESSDARGGAPCSSEGRLPHGYLGARRLFPGGDARMWLSLGRHRAVDLACGARRLDGRSSGGSEVDRAPRRRRPRRPRRARGRPPRGSRCGSGRPSPRPASTASRSMPVRACSVGHQRPGGRARCRDPRASGRPAAKKPRARAVSPSTSRGEVERSRRARPAARRAARRRARTRASASARGHRRDQMRQAGGDDLAGQRRQRVAAGRPDGREDPRRIRLLAERSPAPAASTRGRARRRSATSTGCSPRRRLLHVARPRRSPRAALRRPRCPATDGRRTAARRWGIQIRLR